MTTDAGSSSPALAPASAVALPGEPPATRRTGARARLTRLVHVSELTRLIDSAAALAPGFSFAVRDVDGRLVSGTAASGEARDAEHIAIIVGAEVVGDVVVTAFADGTGGTGGTGRTGGTGATDTAASVAAFLADAIAVAATEGQARRAVAAAAIDDLRELSLLSRLAETIGSSLDPTRIAGCVLDTIRRPLAADVAAVLPPEAAGALLAEHGPAADVAALVAGAAPVIASLRAEDPKVGVCADLLGSLDGGTLGSGLVAVVRTARGPHGAIVLGRDRHRVPFDDSDRRLLAAVASQTAVALERGSLQQEILRRRLVDDELAIGRRIQRSLMPRRFPVVPGWQIAAAYDAAREVGGDLYDAFLLAGRVDQLAFVVADVTGKGIAAAILMADARALLHAAADHAGDPATALQRVNRILVAERATSLFLTAAHGMIDATTGRLTLASAGHEPVVLVRADGTLSSLTPPGRLLGMVETIDATPVEVDIEPGTAIVAYTDGITEARAPDGSFYGEERFAALLSSLAGLPAAAIVEAVVSEIRAFRADAEPSDDLTILVIRRDPA